MATDERFLFLSLVLVDELEDFLLQGVCLIVAERAFGFFCRAPGVVRNLAWLRGRWQQECRWLAVRLPQAIVIAGFFAFTFGLRLLSPALLPQLCRATAPAALPALAWDPLSSHRA